MTGSSTNRVVDERGRRTFAGRADQVGAARRFVAAALPPGSPIRELTGLLVSEAATNALLHSASGRSGGTFAVEYAVDGRRLRVEIRDAGGPSGPRRRVHHLESLTGRGLDLFEALSSRWGVHGGPAGRVVWFELDLVDGAVAEWSS
ncbi:MAG TPA: ATP-binding protein [Actinomycetes bacterium]|jgi:anti-sigma regulatory factor (Ser/Thr protein kinase)|nr:ATP-binding protein [Actinomycetes bacterium]